MAVADCGGALLVGVLPLGGWAVLRAEAEVDFGFFASGASEGWLPFLLMLLPAIFECCSALVSVAVVVAAWLLCNIWEEMWCQNCFCRCWFWALW